MKNILWVSILVASLFSQYEYSKEDVNPTSSTYGEMIWQPAYEGYITLHYFTTQGWAGWTNTFRQLSEFQAELKSDYGYENIVIIGIGQTNISDFNDNFCANSDLPLVMDEYPELPIREQFSPYGQDHYVVILDYDGNYIDHINLPNLGNTQKNYFLSLLEENYNQTILGDLNGDTTLNVADIIIIIDFILSEIYDENGDMNFDGGLNIQDITILLNIIL
mgnify:CR=1 FL=1